MENKCANVFLLPPYGPREILSLDERGFIREDGWALPDIVTIKSNSKVETGQFLSIFSLGNQNISHFGFANDMPSYLRITGNGSFVVLDEFWSLGLLISLSIFLLFSVVESAYFLHKEFPSKKKKITT